ncbi:HAD family hydrolase [uncultured Polaribacter sp.]|uniref:KdsC family phosphatase n=1 Tax=uncultured Polaribacter sp. TaxID=174711 RepID=UPI00260DDDB6|nr:HAD-IIIA family hydrolase [uncultured Polaribacter sp.]
MVFNNEKVKEKALKIKAFLLDVDGVLTDGSIIYDNDGLEYKKFNVKDGQIISHLKSLGFFIGVITGRESDVVKNRCKELKIDFHKHGIKNKLIEYQKFKETYNVNDDEIVYVGDDIIDLCILSKCGLSVTPNDARFYMKESVDIITESKGGEGVFRDIADFVLDSQNLLIEIIEKLKK